MRKIGVSVLLTLMWLGWSAAPGTAMMASGTVPAANPENEEGGVQFFLGVSADIEDGEMKYTIQGSESGGWKSILTWPQEQLTYLGVVASVTALPRLEANFGAWKAVSDDVGVMQDDDWLYADYGTESVIYSETDASIEATQFDLNVRYNAWYTEAFRLGAILGYKYTNWDWEASDGYQITRDSARFYSGPIEGLAVKYTQTLKVPYLGAAASFLPLDTLGLNFYALYSPLAYCDDEDDHVLRYKLSTGDSNGHFWSLGGDARWTFFSAWSVTGKVNYTGYHLEGDQRQEFYAGYDPPVGTTYSGIDLTIEGHQTSVSVLIGYTF